MLEPVLTPEQTGMWEEALKKAQPIANLQGVGTWQESIAAAILEGKAEQAEEDSRHIRFGFDDRRFLLGKAARLRGAIPPELRSDAKE